MKQGKKCGVDADMSKPTKKITICFEPEILEHLRAKVAEDSRSISDIITSRKACFSQKMLSVSRILTRALASLTLGMLILFSR